MAKERIDIVVSERRVAADPENRRLVAAARNRERPARTPVIINCGDWTVLAARGASVSEYLSGPRENVRGQLLNLKWRLENIEDDTPLPFEGATVQPDFGAIRGIQFPLVWHATEAGPWVCDTLLTEPEQIDTLQVPDPEGGLHAKKSEWFRVMQSCVDDFDVRLNGQSIKIKPTVACAGGPIPTAFALAGERLFEWMALEPERVHRLMDIATTSHIQCVQHYHKMAGRDLKAPVWAGCDAAEMISGDMYREFVVPYYLRLWAAVSPPRTFHMCGRIIHLLDILRDEMKIDFLEGFGFPVPPELLAEKLSGRIVLKGGLSPMLLNDGPIEAIQKETTRYMNLLAPAGGFIMSVGGGEVFSTPKAHYQALIDAVRNWKG